MKLWQTLGISAACFVTAACQGASEEVALGDGEGSSAGASYSTGLASEIQSGLIDCGEGSRVSSVGEITSDDGKNWIVPAQTQFETAAKATDLYNECGDAALSSLDELGLASVPLMDAGGDEEFAMFIFADNYFELNINGKLIAVDAVPFTPFNSSVVRFKAARPLTIAIKGVDWEENLGIGSEANRSSSYHPGDAGIVALLQDAEGKPVTITDASWKAQTFYTAPLNDRACLVDSGNVRDSSACASTASDQGPQMSAAHWQVPADWMNADFDDSNWPSAATFTNDVVGVDNKPGYTNFTSVFDAPDADAEFIWSSNLVLDNLVLMRKTVE